MKVAVFARLDTKCKSRSCLKYFVHGTLVLNSTRAYFETAAVTSVSRNLSSTPRSGPEILSS